MTQDIATMRALLADAREQLDAIRRDFKRQADALKAALTRCPADVVPAVLRERHHDR
ncbi:hypothetical protein [Roseomonas genomospecies 6]|uniref:hypothetical protein n=1 Tax=Roseomonas genomospecies 6 TaxID=214106 RepID=UPI00142EB6D5|nr:hypothetical protein [Roseomonas genomospecies 6]